MNGGRAGQLESAVPDFTAVAIEVATVHYEELQHRIAHGHLVDRCFVPDASTCMTFDSSLEIDRPLWLETLIEAGSRLTAIVEPIDQLSRSRRLERGANTGIHGRSVTQGIEQRRARTDG